MRQHYLTPVDINHAAKSGNANLWSTMLLMLGALAFGSALFVALKLTAAQTSLQVQMADLNQSAKSAALVNNSRLMRQVAVAGRSAQADDEATSAKAAIQEIVTPWLSLFRSLEKANIESVKLLKVEPNAKQRNVRISAVADNVDDMMAYINSLNQQSAIRQAELSSHEAIEIDGQTAVEFMVNAVWSR